VRCKNKKEVQEKVTECITVIQCMAEKLKIINKTLRRRVNGVSDTKHINR
jgi:hypothetical protein